MILRGHGVEIVWDGETLLARATTPEGRDALHAPEQAHRLTLTVPDLDTVAVFEAPRRVGGVLILVDRSLEEHRLHFRRDARLEFLALAAELDDAVQRENYRARHLADLGDVDLTDRATTSVEPDTTVSA